MTLQAVIRTVRATQLCKRNARVVHQSVGSAQIQEVELTIQQAIYLMEHVPQLHLQVFYLLYDQAKMAKF